MYQNLIVTFTATEDINNYQHSNLKISKDYLYEDNIIADFLDTYSPSLLNLKITSDNGNREYSYYLHNDILYIKCINGDWIKDGSFYKIRLKFNILYHTIDNTKKDAILFTEEDLDEPIIESTSDYYSIDGLECKFKMNEDGVVKNRCCEPSLYPEFGKFTDNNLIYYIKNNNTWIESEYVSTYARFIFDININTDLEIHTVYQYNNSCSLNKTHYIGIDDDTIHEDCDFEPLIAFNGPNETTSIIYKNEKNTSNIPIHYIENDDTIGIDHEMSLKYNNADLTVICDNIIEKKWDKNLGC